MSQQTALIIDDEPDIRELLEITLGRMNLHTRSACNVKEAYQWLERESFDLCLTDMRLPDGTGLDIIKFVQKNHSQIPIAMITAYGCVDTATQALKAGAFDFITKPVDLVRLRELVSSALRLRKEPTAPAPVTEGPLLGSSLPMQKLRSQIAKLARSQAPVYISGESGSGKELVARQIHQQGGRAQQPFIPVNCGAIPAELMESEFFGHKKGSFSGATEDKPGLFQAAHGGTLFLDEVADLPLAMQVKLLRALQEKAIRPVGSQQEQLVDVRILSATHKNLAHEVSAERFRQDLYYRLNVIELLVPPLRERPEDIEQLSNSILARLSADGLPVRLHPDALAKLQGYVFSGNVRELENILERAYTLAEGEFIHPHDLKTNHMPSAAPQPTVAAKAQAAPQLAPSNDLSQYALENIDNLEEHLEEVERKLITQALEETRWNRTAAAERLGLTFRSLRYRLKKLGID
ncbi:MAG: sigma-54-dependent Fis family transcriptional regulator [Gammaproteobacteria bacterium]|nr:sigma-54-dependent Fis family transcriptional regulator [Gammaproteobacteria bacterium]